MSSPSSSSLTLQQVSEKVISFITPTIEPWWGTGDKGSHHHDYYPYYEELIRPFEESKDEKPFHFLKLG